MDRGRTSAADSRDRADYRSRSVPCMRSNLMFGINRTSAQRVRYLVALRRVLADETDGAELEFLLDNLAILDNKAMALMQFDSLVLTVLALFTGWQLGFDPVAIGLVCGVLLVGVVLSIVSCALCLLMVYAHWIAVESLGEVARCSYALVLLRLRDRRTVLYRVAWWLGLASLASLLVGVGIFIVSGVPAW